MSASIISGYSTEEAVTAIIEGHLTLDEAVKDPMMNREELTFLVRKRKYNKPDFGQ